LKTFLFLVLGLNTSIKNINLIYINTMNKMNKVKGIPPYIDPKHIHKIRNKYDLLELELKYDKFLYNYQHYLYLHNLIEEYLDIRDALTIQRQRIEREEKKKLFNEGIIGIFHAPCEYDHNLQCLLPDDLRLTQEEIRQGYVPCQNEPKEYKCGCETIKYVARCECRRVSSICTNATCNEKLYPILKLDSYCIMHHQLVDKKKQLEQKLSSIKRELSYIKRHSNSFDHDDPKKIKRYSRYPWKNL
jgi:hypothetical protein